VEGLHSANSAMQGKVASREMFSSVLQGYSVMHFVCSQSLNQKSRDKIDHYSNM
jgi:hypothetical protein